MTPRFAALSFKRCPHVQWTMPSIQYEKHSLHCVLGSVSNNPNSSTLPTSWIIFLDVVLNGLQASFCCGSYWRDCRWGWFSIFLTSSRTRQLSTCFTTECGNPGILKSMSTSLTIDCSWFASRITANNGFLRSIMVCFIFHIEVRAKRSRQTSFPFYHDLGLSLVGLVVNFWTVEQLLHLVLEQLLNPIVSSNHVSKKSLESDEVCRRGWLRSILFDRTSILSVEQTVCDAIHSIVMSLPCFPHVLCKTRCFQLDRVKMLVFFVQRIHKQKEYFLSVAQHLWSWCQSWIHDEVWIDCFSYMINVL